MSQDTNNLHTLLSEFYEIQSELDALEYMQGQIRDKINIETKSLGGKVAIRGLASVSIIPASTSHSYDTKALDQLLADAVAAGDMHTAQALTDARKQSSRKETLRIVRDK